MLIKTYTSAVHGISAFMVRVEVHLTEGIGYFLVGLPDSAIKESQQRIVAAFDSVGLRWPGKRIVVNLAPADIRKEGTAYDLPLAIAILAAHEQVPQERLKDLLMTGELALDGSLRSAKGVLPVALHAKAKGFKGMIVPMANVREAAVVEGIDVFGMKDLAGVIAFLKGGSDAKPYRFNVREDFMERTTSYDLDFSDVKGQENVKRALEVAAAGGHNLLLVGPPGSGKTMLAQRLPGIIPPLTLEEALETTKIHSVAGKLSENTTLVLRRPFRAPHHTISDVALVGGGSFPKPGEISLAHNGVLFLDELPEYKRSVLEVMRQPLEERVIRISRARFALEYPASFMLVASMNPCPCGFFNHPAKPCICKNGMVQKYLGRISGPLLDRIDLHVEVTPVGYDKLESASVPEGSAPIRERVMMARQRQTERFTEMQGIYSNAQMSGNLMKRLVPLNAASRSILKMAMEKLGLSARAYDRIIKVSRSIADLEGVDQVEPHHVAEAVNYRSLDRDIWGG